MLLDVMMDDMVQLLWTGGFDSTYRLLELTLVQHRHVQPIYILNQERRSAEHEIRSMTAVRERINGRGHGGLLAPTVVLLKDDFAVSDWITETHVATEERGIRIGSQYRWLSAIAETLDWEGVELCFERYPTPSALRREIFVDPESPPSGIALRDTDIAELFRRFSFPVMHLYKSEMAERAEQHGFDEILTSSWFCHDPFGGKPCGRCRPCELADRDRGMIFASAGLVAARHAARRLWRRSKGKMRQLLAVTMKRTIRSEADGVSPPSEAGGMRPR
jgi:7-cyano-7-deazaguanine synthase